MALTEWTMEGVEFANCNSSRAAEGSNGLTGRNRS
jgi:hypothetical protein